MEVDHSIENARIDRIFPNSVGWDKRRQQFLLRYSERSPVSVKKVKSIERFAVAVIQLHLFSF